MANALASETSPYLLQHKDNPVAWLPWGEEAKDQARERDAPILLSIGYSACHWCHVMERESFEDPETARYMNESFVPVKVDREERPDVDAIYMEAVQSMTGHGGWPMTVFIDPDGVPFYGGTYFPPEPRQGMPSFLMVMEAVIDAWEKRRDELRERAPQTAERLGAIARIEPTDGPLNEGMLEQAEAGLGAAADRQNGGFGAAPKFPPASAIDFLLARGETAIPQRTLDAMCAGGIYDQLAGGFARYSVDSAWMVPHFEKMLYDNAVLARSYVRGYQELGHARYRRVAVETLEWALEEMRGPEGGFYSALDADSEGEEGRFYVWEAGEIREALGEAGLDESEVREVEAYLGVSERGNFEGKNILHLRGGAGSTAPPAFERARAALLGVRAKRVRPGLDDKRLCGWNALMVGTLAEAGAVLAEPRYVEAAAACADFIFERMRDTGGRLLRTFNRDQARLNAYLEDHAYLLEAMVSLYEARFDPRDYERAVEVAEAMIGRFSDQERGGFFTTSDDHEQLIARRKDLDDHPIPSGNSAAALGLLRLGRLNGEPRYLEAAEGTLRLLAEPASDHPQALAYALVGIAASIGPAREVAIVSTAGDGDGEDPERERMLELVRSRYRPGSVLAAGAEGTETPPLLAGRSPMDGHTAAYVCRDHACHAPVDTAEALAGELG